MSKLKKEVSVSRGVHNALLALVVCFGCEGQVSSSCSTNFPHRHPKEFRENRYEEEAFPIFLVDSVTASLGRFREKRKSIKHCCAIHETEERN